MDSGLFLFDLCTLYLSSCRSVFRAPQLAHRVVAASGYFLMPRFSRVIRRILTPPLLRFETIKLWPLEISRKLPNPFLRMRSVWIFTANLYSQDSSIPIVTR